MNLTLGRALTLIVGTAALLAFQNCGSGFSALSKTELLSMSCGQTVQCDEAGFPLGKIVIDQLPASDYPFGSYSQSRVETKTLVIGGDSMTSLLRLRGLPQSLACKQTWLRDSYAVQNGLTTLDLLGSLEKIRCRIGDVTQESDFLNELFKSGCFFVETNYIIKNDLATGQLTLNQIGTAVQDDDMSRPRVATARVQFRCSLPSELNP